MELFAKPATVGDVVGWVVTVPMILLSFTAGPMTPRIFGDFHAMFNALHGELPMLTIAFLGIPQWLLPLPLMALALGSAWIMFTSDSSTNKALYPMLFLWLWTVYVGMLLTAIVYPILALQAAVRGG